MLNASSCCGSVGTAVASGTSDLRFESSHQQKCCYEQIFC